MRRNEELAGHALPRTIERALPTVDDLLGAPRDPVHADRHHDVGTVE